MTAADLRASALAYTAMGLRVVPVAFKGKLPVDGDGWQTVRFRRDADQVSKAWGESLNVGILLGPESLHLADVDLDWPEARELADEYLPLGAWIFGRASSPRSHRIYIAPGAHSITLKDNAQKEIVGLRAKPAGGEGHQTVFPPSVHPSGEPIEWDRDAGDALELPTMVDPAVLSVAVRQLAVHAFLTRHLGGADAARDYLRDPQPGRLSPEVASRVRDLAGLPRAGAVPARRTRPQGDDVFESVRSAGIESVAALFGLEWDARRRALVRCPGCGMDTRSDHDRRAAAGVVKARGTGVELAAHGKCGFFGDAIAVAASAVLGTTKPASRAHWRRLVDEIKARSAA